MNIFYPFRLKKLSLFCCITWLLQTSMLFGDPVITFFFQPYPLLSDYTDSNKQKPSELAQHIAESLKKPGKIAKACVFGLRNEHVAGIIATHDGFLDISNGYGQITFPRKHEKPHLKLIVTSKIIPVMMTGNTVHHWELEKKVPTVAYRADQKQDQETKAYFWNIQPIELPDSNRIPLDTIVILAKPKNMYIPSGVTLTSDSPNLILPDIYVKKGIKSAAHALYLLNLKHFFSPIRYMYHKQSTGYSRQLAM